MSNSTYHPRGSLVDGYKIKDHPNYARWANMKVRCNNPNEASYVNYGGRGIGYDPRWEHFANFCEDMGLPPSPNHTLERVDNDKGYSKENCTWGTRHEQSLNRRRFKNNTSGLAGVKRRGSGRYSAQIDFDGKRYLVPGSFPTADEAFAARTKLLCLLQKGEEPVFDLPVRYDSSTGVRGISRHTDGGYLVRTTIGGKRVYLGYFKDFEAAKGALQNAKV